MTCEVRCGCIYKLPFPFTDLSSRKARPALALGEPDQYGDVRFLFITTTPVTAEQSGYALTADDYDGASLPFPSYIRLDKPFLLSASLAIKPLARLTDVAMAKVLRRLIAVEIPRFSELEHTPKPFVPGVTPVPPSGKVIGSTELQHLVEASLDGWLTTGRFNTEFEQRFAEFTSAKFALTTNSGSSANLLAFSTLTSPRLGDRAIKPGDEVITVAAGFPTTVNPIVQNGAVPVFVDIHIPTYNIAAEQIEGAVTERTRAIMIAHTLGNPFNLDEVARVARKYDLWLVEDCCDALGARYDGQHVGTFGHLATCSFYPAHHITMGEGGMVFTSDPQLRLIAESFRDWGRDCYCAPGRDNTCGKRFGWQLGSLPFGYDHKYTYSHLGYNLKITDMQAACALAQLDRLPAFIEARQRNFAFLRDRLASCEEFLILPEGTPHSEPSWFGFLITLRDSAAVSRVDLLQYLAQYQIGTRLLFAGNLTRQPYFQGRNFRIAGALTNTEIVMNDTFWIGVYPGLSEEMLEFTAQKIENFFGVGF